jgi:hypothetical protein
VLQEEDADTSRVEAVGHMTTNFVAHVSAAERNRLMLLGGRLAVHCGQIVELLQAKQALGPHLASIAFRKRSRRPSPIEHEALHTFILHGCPENYSSLGGGGGLRHSPKWKEELTFTATFDVGPRELASVL